MIGETVTITPKVDLANQVITIEELTERPGLLDHRDLVRQHAMAVIDLKERAIRDALILLGWTPPAPAPNPLVACSDRDAMFRVRTHDPSASVLAANNAKHFVTRHFDQILGALIDRNLTAREIAERTGLTVVQVARRTTDLQRKGQIEVIQTSDGSGGSCDLERGGCRVWGRLK